MFPVNDYDWIPYIQSAVPNNVNPCWVDIVGDVQHPAAYYYLYPTTDPTEVAFRMRLNGSPLSNNPNVYKLKEFVWGVTISHASNGRIFTILVNASGGTYNLQVIDSAMIYTYNVPITLHSPSLPTDNIRVVDAGANFPCENPMIPDEDFFLDFTMPTNKFPSFDFESSTYKLCYFTSTQDNPINKDDVCGMIINPPIDTPVLCVSKQIISAPYPVCTNETYSWIMLITVYNCGNVAANNVVLTDILNYDIVLASTPVFIPNAGVSYTAGTRTVTWNIGTVNVGDVFALTINMTGYFENPGHYTLDMGNVTGTGLTMITFADHGILVYDENQMTIEKQIISGPLSIEKCKISTWTLSILVSNTGASVISNVVINDEINSLFTIESGPQLTPSAGYAASDGNSIIWTIDNLAGNSSATLTITVTGFFSAEGHQIFNSGSVLNQCMQIITFHDTGVDVLPTSITKDIKIYGDIIDCKTNELLYGVSATLYDNHCKVIETYLFNQHYELSLPAGTYTVLFEKEGYNRKFLAIVLQSDTDIAADINMAPKSTLSYVNTDNANLDMFSDIICEKIDAEVVYSSFVCINSEAQVESLNDVIDSSSCTIICNSKLRLLMSIEKNLVYRLNQIKDFKYYTKSVPICFPLKSGNGCKTIKYCISVNNVCHYKEQNIVYNIAYLHFVANIVCEDDVLIDGTAQDECKD